VVPLSRSHHRALHRVGNEQGWWQATGIDPLEFASKFWGQSWLVETAGSESVQTVARKGAMQRPRCDPKRVPPIVEQITQPASVAALWRPMVGRRERCRSSLECGEHRELFHTNAGIAFADLIIDGHRETWP
jgi:hypothetical protein